MEREILFRGKQLDNGEWVYGYPFVSDTGGSAYILRGSHDFTTEYKVGLDTLKPYTGLTDKNGVKIFEGDILQCEQYFYDPCKLDDSDSKFMLRGVVVYDETSKDFPPVWNIQFESKDGDLCKYLFNCEFEVIGNIHENPELLEVQNEAD